MDRTACISSNVASLGYDQENLVVEVEFVGGRIYHYLDVPQDVWEARAEWESIGKWVANVIKADYEVEFGEYVPEEEHYDDEADPPTDDQIRDDEAQVEGDLS